MLNILKSKNFLFLSVFSTALFFVVFLNVARVFESAYEILLVPKNKTVFQNISQIVQNAENLPEALSFYDYLISEEGVFDPMEEYSPEKRQAFWKEKINSVRKKDSHIVVIKIRDRDRFVSEEMAGASVRSFSLIFSRYYNIKEDLDIRVINGPITREILEKNFWLLFLQALGTGVAISFALNYILNFFDFPKSPRQKEDEEKNIRQWPEENFFSSPEKTEKSENKNKLEKTILENEAHDQPFFSDALNKKSSPPVNLPAEEVSEDLSRLFPGNIFPEEALFNSEEKEDIREEKESRREPTPEEIKERLNKLLSGNL